MSKATELIKYYEGFYGKPYKCSRGVWTIGWGSTFYPDGTKVKQTDAAIDQAYGQELLEITMAGFIKQLEKEFSDFGKWDEGRQTALLAFIFNCGIGTLRKCRFYKAIKAGKDEQTVANLLADSATTAGGKPLKGLKRRRLAESLVYLGVDVDEAVKQANKTFP